MATCNLKINGEERKFEVDGEFYWGEDEFLFNRNDNVISKTSWINSGYTVTPLLTDEAFSRLQLSIKKIILDILGANGVHPDPSFSLEDYHQYVTSDEIHGQVIQKTRMLTNHDFDFDLEEILQKCIKLVGYNLSSFNPILGSTHVQLRINRPKSLDINPLHKDGYLEYYKDVLNVWLPIAGCNEKSNLPLLPGSHMLNEKDLYRTAIRSAKINGNVYNVPCILEINGGINMVRQHINYGDGIVFTPHLIHGAAFNDNPNSTRMALELRLTKTAE